MLPTWTFLVMLVASVTLVNSNVYMPQAFDMEVPMPAQDFRMAKDYEPVGQFHNSHNRIPIPPVHLQQPIVPFPQLPSHIFPVPNNPGNSSYRIVCYYDSAAVDRPDSGRVAANDVNPFLCSHVIYAHAILHNIKYTITSANEERDITNDGYKNASDLVLVNADVKVMISIGDGSNGQNEKFSTMAKSDRLRANFVQSAVNFLQTHGFHGLDINWEPSNSLQEDGRCEDKVNLVKLVKELRIAFEPYGFVLSAAISPLKEIIDDGYDLPELSRALHFINVKTYNFRNANSTKADHHSPLHRRPHDEWENVFHNIEFVIKYLVEKGAETTKLVLGIAYYGRSYTLQQSNVHDFGSEARGPGRPGLYTNEAGCLAYYEICPGILSGTWTVQRDEYGKVPYAFSHDQWVAYEDITSIQEKANFIKEQNLGGALIRSFDLDDITGRCGEKLPLTRTIYTTLCNTQPNVLQQSPYRQQVPSEVDDLPGSLYITVKMPFAPIHKMPALEVRKAVYAANSVCKGDSFIRDPTDCSKFYRCSSGLLHQYMCPLGLHYNEVTFTCDWAHYLNCQSGSGTGDSQDGDYVAEDVPQESGTFQCERDGIFPHPDDCEKYYMCANGEPILLQCSSGTAFSTRNKICDWKHNVKCEKEPERPDRPQKGKEQTTRRTTTTTTTEYPELPSTPKRRLPTTSTTREITTSKSSRKPTTQRPRQTSRPTSSTAMPDGGTETAVIPDLTDGFKVVCYFTNWAWYRPGRGKYLPEDVDVSLCTHVIYAFTVLDGERLQLKPHDPWADIDNHFFERVVALKKKNPKIKILVGVGGWTDSLGNKYSRLVNNPASRQNFIAHALEFIKRYGFDGLDLDWEYPKCWQVDCKKGPDEDKQGFAAWVRELRAAFDSNIPRLLLTAAVSPSKKVIDLAYEVADIAKDLDFINVMTYDYHGSWEKQTGHLAPLYNFPGSEHENFNANFTLHYYMELGAPREKLIMGMPLYAQTWTLADTNEHGMFAKANGPGEAGPYSRQAGMLGYNEICTKLNGGGWTVVTDPLGRIGSFAYKGQQWISFDDVASIKRKSEFVQRNRFGGAMIWALDFDDFRNACCEESYPLMKTINRVLRNYPAKHSSSGSCPQQNEPETPYKHRIMTQVRKICITSRCTF